MSERATAGDQVLSARPEMREKRRVLVDNCNPDRTVAELRDALASAGDLFERGVPVRLAFDQIKSGMVAQPLTPSGVVRQAHSVCRPYQIKLKDGAFGEIDARLPDSVAKMYLDWRGDWDLRPLNGITTAPLLQDDGTIRTAVGYDPATGMWCEDVPELDRMVPEQPTETEAAEALITIRQTFQTFCFADAEMIEGTNGIKVVNVSKPPGRDESSFLHALLTAVCRPTLYLAPGVLFRAPPLSGAGAGKGLLARCACIVAFGREPHAVTSGSSAAELEKRISAELMEGHPALFLDNLNNMAFGSHLLASAITERPAKVRVLGRSQMMLLNATAFVVLTGNGLSVSEDLARRFIAIELDPRTENPEARPFMTDIRAEVKRRRVELLAALLTIWRWGRITSGIKRGLPLGSFRTWCRWVRDPLLALGCRDPVERIAEAKERDARRQEIADALVVWWNQHEDRPATVRDLHDDVKAVLDPQGRGRQYLSSLLTNLAGTRTAGFLVTRQAAVGKWGAATYALERTSNEPNRQTAYAPDGPDADCAKEAA